VFKHSGWATVCKPCLLRCRSVDYIFSATFSHVGLIRCLNLIPNTRHHSQTFTEKGVHVLFYLDIGASLCLGFVSKFGCASWAVGMAEYVYGAIGNYGRDHVFGNPCCMTRETRRPTK
jgi:hypothetical protein